MTGGALGWPDIIVVSCLIAAMCFNFLCADVVVVLPRPWRMSLAVINV